MITRSGSALRQGGRSGACAGTSLGTAPPGNAGVSPARGRSPRNVNAGGTPAFPGTSARGVPGEDPRRAHASPSRRLAGSGACRRGTLRLALRSNPSPPPGGRRPGEAAHADEAPCPSRRSSGAGSARAAATGSPSKRRRRPARPLPSPSRLSAGRREAAPRLRGGRGPEVPDRARGRFTPVTHSGRRFPTGRGRRRGARARARGVRRAARRAAGPPHGGSTWPEGFSTCSSSAPAIRRGASWRRRSSTARGPAGSAR